MNRLSFLILLLGAFASLAVAASAPTFCKCTCFTNSTIIEIKPKSSSGKTSGSSGSSSGSSHLKLPSEGDDTDATDDQQEQEPAPDPFATHRRSVFEDNDDLNDLFSTPAGEEREQYTTSRSRRRGSSKRAQVSPSCNQCNKAFCLSQSLPICKDAEDKDVVTMCFQRDSRKDQIIVWGFILGTAGLLGWAGVQKVMAMKERGSFMGLPGLGAGGFGVPRGGARRGVRVGAAQMGAAGNDGGRGSYVAVGSHSRESSIQTG